jgi:hypothetical protein
VSFSFGSRSRADSSMRGWRQLRGAVAKCAKSLLADETGRCVARFKRGRMRRTDGWWTTLSGR